MFKNYRDSIDRDIKQQGYHVAGVADVGECAHCKAEGIEHLNSEGHDYISKTHTRVNDGFVYTVGFYLSGFPELAILVGPTGSDGDVVLSSKQMRERITSASNLVNHIYVGLKNGSYVLDSKRAMNSDRVKDLWWVMLAGDTPEDNKKTEDFAKLKFLKSTADYYGHNDYSVAVFVPHIHKLT